MQQQAHQRAHFILRAGPILRGEGVNRQRFYAPIVAGADDAAQRLGAGAVTHRARQAAPLGPAAVSIHDDGHMARQAGRQLFSRP